MNTARRQLILVAAALCLALGFSLPATAQQQSPTEALRVVVDKMVGILKNDSLSTRERRSQVREEVYNIFDFRAMSQSVLSTNWRDASEAQQTEFQELFSQLLESTYVDRLDAYDYNNEQVRFRDEEVNGGRATVETVIVTRGNGNIPVNYRLREKDGGWFVYDVIVENVSLVSSYRETYRSVVRRSGMDSLLQQMRTKIEELQSQNQQA